MGLDLPPELVTAIFCLLDFRDIVRLQAVCKPFFDLINTTAQLQYLIELGVSACVDGPSRNPLSPGERLRRLKEHQASWKDPIVERLGTIELETSPLSPRSQSRRYEVQDEVLVVVYLENRILDYPYFFNCLDVMRLDDPSRSPESWTLKLDGPYIGLAFNPAQDLLIVRCERPSIPQSVFATRLQPLSLRKGTPHPRARCQDIHIPFYTHLDMSISGDFIALLIMHHVGEDDAEEDDGVTHDAVALVNWTSGSITVISPSERTQSIRGFSFLSPFQFATLNELVPALNIYSTDISDWQSVIQVASFELPRTRDYALTASNLNASLICDRIDPSSSSPALPYHPKPSTANILGIQLRYSPTFSTRGDAVMFYTVVVSVRAMLQLLATDGWKVKEPSRINFPWEFWGPSCTRWFRQLTPLSRLQMHMYGYRIALPSRILDFNPLGIGRDLCRGSAPSGYLTPPLDLQARRDGSNDSQDGISIPVGENMIAESIVVSPENVLSQDESTSRLEEAEYDSDLETVAADANIVTEPTIIPAGKIFCQDIVSALAYRETVFETALPYTQLHANERLIGLETDGGGRGGGRLTALHFLSVE